MSPRARAALEEFYLGRVTLSPPSPTSSPTSSPARVINVALPRGSRARVDCAGVYEATAARDSDSGADGEVGAATPTYRQRDGPHWLYRIHVPPFSAWMIGRDVGSLDGALLAANDAACRPEDIKARALS